MTNRKWRTLVFTVFRRRSLQRTLRALLTCFRALRAIVWNACSTLMASLALVSKYGMLFLLWHQAWALLVVTCEDEEQIIHLSHCTVVEDIIIWPMLTCLFSKSILLPSTTKGKFSGSRGLAWIRNSSLQLSSVLKVLGAVTSNTRTQQSAPR